MSWVTSDSSEISSSSVDYYVSMIYVAWYLSFPLLGCSSVIERHWEPLKMFWVTSDSREISSLWFSSLSCSTFSEAYSLSQITTLPSPSCTVKSQDKKFVLLPSSVQQRHSFKTSPLFETSLTTPKLSEQLALKLLKFHGSDVCSIKWWSWLFLYVWPEQTRFLEL